MAIARSACRSVGAAVLAMGLSGCGPSPNMSFFVTSKPGGDGGDLGGLAGADAHCQTLAVAAGSGKHTWRAYLSTTADGGQGAVNARDRIGTGPWFNAKGVEIAASLAELHGPGNKLGGNTSLDEEGHFILANNHDILTGSNMDGTAATGDVNCRNWTSTQGHAIVGHSNKVGSIGDDRARSWNSAHLSAGCTVPALQSLGSRALLYCFAVD